jgi:hypothetical protein
MNPTHVSFIRWLEAVSLGIVPMTECMGPGPGRSRSATMNLAGRLGQGRGQNSVAETFSSAALLKFQKHFIRKTLVSWVSKS